MLDKNPCITCTRRSEICHAQCVAYSEWVAGRRAALDAKKAQRKGAQEADQRAIDRRIKSRRRREM